MSKFFTLEALQIDPLFPPYVLKQELPATEKQLEFIHNARHQIVKILNGEDTRLLLIVGPCSIHDQQSAKDYALKLKNLSENVSQHFFVVMRTYFEKPRTALGWKGMLYDPHLNGSNDIVEGLRKSRELLLSLAEMNVPTATEFLDPITPNFIGDLVSWACIGARTAESQIHRQFASGLSMPVAFKNSTSGNIDVAVNGVIAALSPHVFFGIDESGQLSIVRTKGNPHAHIALRGGESQSNYDPQSIALALKKLKNNHLSERLIVDCSHDNSRRKYEDQTVVFQSIIHQYTQGNANIRGIALEGNLFAGKQPMPSSETPLQYAVSLTDPCLDWTTTENLIQWGYSMLYALAKTDNLDGTTY